MVLLTSNAEMRHWNDLFIDSENRLHYDQNIIVNRVLEHQDNIIFSWPNSNPIIDIFLINFGELSRHTDCKTLLRIQFSKNTKLSFVISINPSFLGVSFTVTNSKSRQHPLRSAPRVLS